MRKLLRRVTNHPLAAPIELQIPGAEIVACAIARYIRESLGLGDILGFPANHDYQFSLIVKFCGDLDRKLDGALVPGERVIEFAEKNRLGGNRQINLFGVAPVVQTHADNFFRAGNDGSVLNVSFTDKRGTRGS